MTLLEKIEYQQQLQTAFHLDLITLQEFLQRSVSFV
jgi:hypothetical protein